MQKRGSFIAFVQKLIHVQPLFNFYISWQIRGLSIERVIEVEYRLKMG